MSHPAEYYPKRPGYRFLRFVEGALKDAVKAADGENRRVSYWVASNHDRMWGANVKSYIIAKGWGESTGYESFRINDAGRAAIAEVRKRLEQF